MFAFSWKRLLYVGALATLPSGLFAVDGVILINQASALAGNITPGDMPGFPITISQPGMYRLSGNLIVPDANTTGIEVTSENVTIDLNGFSILGPVICSPGNSESVTCPAGGKGIGIHMAGGFTTLTGVHVSNGVIRGMGSWGMLIQGPGSLAEGVTVASNGGGGMVVNGSIVRSTANSNGGPEGILALIIRDSTANFNQMDGITTDASGGVATGNIASFNGGNGINAPNANVTGNMMVRNAGFGLTVTCPSVVVNNSMISNTQGTIQTKNTEPCFVSGNGLR